VQEGIMRTTWVRVWPAVLLLGYLAVADPETRSAPQETVDAHGNAYTFLNSVLKRYSDAKTYHIERVEETQLDSELRRSWERRSITAVVLPDKRYRFECQSDMGRGVQISDVVSEWFYLPQIGQYTKGPAPASVPGPVPRVPIFGLNLIRQAQYILRGFSGVRSLIRSATYLADERIDVNGRPVLCTVVQAKGQLPRVAGTTRRIAATFTFWIDKKDEVIWKETDHREGPLLPEAPRVEYTMDRTEWYKASDPDAQSAPEELFVFRPSEPVELAKQFANPTEKSERELQGRQAPAVKLGAKEGQVVSLETFQGKPVLLDFWATWCAPCVESMPAVEKLYRETADKGLVLLSIDEDEDVETGAKFLAKRKQPWPNYHLTEEIADAFPAHGIPYFVLVDASGKVVYSKEGVDDAGLRAAVARLGPQFAGVSETSPLAKP
jgi:thiol-disulfide isomerase/thioredoxin